MIDLRLSTVSIIPYFACLTIPKYVSVIARNWHLFGCGIEVNNDASFCRLFVWHAWPILSQIGPPVPSWSVQGKLMARARRLILWVSVSYISIWNHQFANYSLLMLLHGWEWTTWLIVSQALPDTLWWAYIRTGIGFLKLNVVWDALVCHFVP